MPSPIAPPVATPSAILLATDLSARCDRALARALQLARQWKARLVVATVLPEAMEASARLSISPTESDEVHAARQRLRRLLEAETEDVLLDVRVLHGHVGRALLRLAAEENCELILTGIASDPLLELPFLGSSVLWLTRHSQLPVLIVHERVRGPYRYLAVASDFSDSAHQAARRALSLMGPPLQLSLVHALESTGSILLTGDRTALEQQTIATAREQAQALLADLRPLLAQAHAEAHIEPGTPATVLQRHVQATGAELVIVATHGRSALFDLLIGSVARQLVAALETDTLLVRDPRASLAATAIAGLQG